jgi:hypothetical protein
MGEPDFFGPKELHHRALEQLPHLAYCINDDPHWVESIILGFQHYLTMLGTTVLIPTLVFRSILGESVGWFFLSLDMISFVLFSISFWVGNGVAAFRSINHLKRKWVYDVGFNFFSKICIIVSVYVCVCYCRVIYREWCRVRFLFQRSILCCRLYWVLGCRQ